MAGMARCKLGWIRLGPGDRVHGHRVHGRGRARRGEAAQERRSWRGEKCNDRSEAQSTHERMQGQRHACQCPCLCLACGWGALSHGRDGKMQDGLGQGMGEGALSPASRANHMAPCMVRAAARIASYADSAASREAGSRRPQPPSYGKWLGPPRRARRARTACTCRSTMRGTTSSAASAEYVVPMESP
jgi:hypothetical protein